jgi:hypothetical protein
MKLRKGVMRIEDFGPWERTIGRVPSDDKVTIEMDRISNVLTALRPLKRHLPPSIGISSQVVSNEFEPAIQRMILDGLFTKRTDLESNVLYFHVAVVEKNVLYNSEFDAGVPRKNSLKKHSEPND